MKIPQHSLKSNIIRILYFVLHGSFKILFLILGLCASVITILLLSFIKLFVKNEIKFRSFCTIVVRYPVRLLIIGLGIVHIKVIGKCDSNAKILVSNHISMVDPILIGLQKVCYFIAASEVEKEWFVRLISMVVNVMFFDKYKRGNISEKLIKLINNEEVPPLLIFPEGDMTNGGAILKFRTGAFLTDSIIQPISLRFKLWGIPKNFSHVSFVDLKPNRFFFDMLTIPFITIDLEFLKPIEFKKNANEGAIQVQLEIANNLGIPAITQRNQDFYEQMTR